MTTTSMRPRVPDPLDTSTWNSQRSAQALYPEPPTLIPTSEAQRVAQPSISPDQMQNSQSYRKSQPQPIEEPARPPKMFLPEPLETTTRSRRKKGPEKTSVDQETDITIGTTGPSIETIETKPRRKFAPQPIETTMRSSRKAAAEDVGTSKRHRCTRTEEDDHSEPQPGKRRFVPQPIETTTTRRRGKRRTDLEKEGDDAAEKVSASQSPTPRSLSGSKFAPELLETARGSYKRTQPGVPLSAVPAHLRPSASPDKYSQDGSGVPESRFSAAALARRHHPERQHSYATPDLPMVESDSSEDEEDSDVPSLSATPSISSEDVSDVTLPFRGRQLSDVASHGHSPSFSLAAGEKLLREQAMAAYINENNHEHVDHFIDREDDNETVRRGRLSGHDGTDIRTFRRDSGVDLDWHLAEMRKHHSQLAALKKNLRENTAGASRFSAAALASRKAVGAKKRGTTRKGTTRQLAGMRNAASPPMLGEKLVFPRSISPKHTRLTPDQKPIPRNKAHAEEAVAVQGGGPMLWGAKADVSDPGTDGLWMGMCQKGDGESGHTSPIHVKYGIMTPVVEKENPFGTVTPGKAHGRFGHGMGFLPKTPPRSTIDEFAESLDKKLTFEQEIDKEFHSGVVTQVYNYLSLGYPSLAHEFDEELSKISRIPIEDLRRDDERADAKGYVGAPEGEGMDLERAVDGKCARWTALRLYIREWARQLPTIAEKDREDWGIRARRGSWAL